ncbi:unnamed protein product [Caenorhabditis brenneri]
MTTFKDNVLDAIIYTYHSENFSPQLAYEKLQKLTGAESYTLQDVEKLYKKIDEKVFSLMKPNEVNLVDLPWHFNKEVVSYLDVASRMSLRKTCHLFRHLVDIEKLRINTLDIGLSLRYIKITINESLKICYTKSKSENCCKIEYNDSSRDVKSSFTKAAFRDLAIILSNPRWEIRDLSVHQNWHDAPNVNNNLPFNTILAFPRFMNSLENKPKVEYLEVSSPSLDTLLYSILRNLDETFIKIIKIDPMDLLPFRKYEIFELPQWKNATSIFTLHLTLIPDKWHHFLDFNISVTCFWYTDGLTLDQFLVWKDKLLQNPQLNQARIRIGSRTGLDLTIINELNESLGIQGAGYNETNPVWAEINYPGSQKKLSICVAKNLIWFKGPEYEEPEVTNEEDEEIEYEEDSSDTIITLSTSTFSVSTPIEKEGGCLVEFSHRFSALKSILKRSKFIEGEMKQLATQDLKTILINPKLEIEALEIEKEDGGREFYPEFKEFVEMLPTLDHKLHIEHFCWHVDFSTDDLVEIFKSMKPGKLRTIHSETHRRTTNWSHWENKIFNLPQWKEAKTLYCECLISWKSCIYLAHFEKVILHKNSHADRRDKITGELIMTMKDKLLENKKLDQIVLHDNYRYHSFKKLQDIFSPFQSHSDPRWAEFNYPNSNKKLMIRVYDDTIWFKGPCFKPDPQIEGMMDGEEESEEEVTDEEEASEEESDFEDPDADDN